MTALDVYISRAYKITLLSLTLTRLFAGLNYTINRLRMFLRQVVFQRGIPFEMKLPKTALLNYSSLTREQFDAEMKRDFGG